MNVYVVCVMHHMSLHAGNANKFNLEGKGQGAVYTFRLYIYIIMCVCVCLYPGSTRNANKLPLLLYPLNFERPINHTCNLVPFLTVL